MYIYIQAETFTCVYVSARQIETITDDYDLMMMTYEF